jgi:hypothetical protein
VRASPRVLIGPVEIAGYYRDLSVALRGQGVTCDFVTYADHPFAYGGESKQPLLLRLARHIAWRGGAAGPRSGLEYLRALPAVVLQSLWALTAMLRYDVFIFGFGHSLLRGNWDLPVLRWLGKRVISNLGHGSDARPPFADGTLQSHDGRAPVTATLEAAVRRVASQVARHERYASVVIGAPYSSTPFATRQMVDWFALGIPCRGPEHTPHEVTAHAGRSARPVRIVHAPSHPAVKGTPLIVAAIESLIRRGYAIELELIQGRPVRDVLTALERCDFIIDQIYSDTPMAGFAAQAAWFGKPAVVGGYGLERLRDLVPASRWAPSQICHPDEVEGAIEALIVDADLRGRLGRNAQAFVQEQWRADRVAQRYVRIIEDDIPADWWLDPSQVVYLEGCGQPATRTQEAIRDLVTSFGTPALGLQHRPDLESAFLAFAGVNSANPVARDSHIPQG